MVAVPFCFYVSELDAHLASEGLVGAVFTIEQLGQVMLAVFIEHFVSNKPVVHDARIISVRHQFVFMVSEQKTMTELMEDEIYPSSLRQPVPARLIYSDYALQPKASG